MTGIDDATPRPWKVAAKNRIWYAGHDPKIGNVEIAQFGDMSYKELVPFNAKRWQADCALAVLAVNTLSEREALLREAADFIEDTPLESPSGATSKIQAELIACIRTALGESGEKK